MTCKILLVDDVPENIDLLRRMIADLNCHVTVATSGEKALALIDRSPPDILLLDVMMPGIDGFEVCRTIRATHSRDEIAIIFVTGRQDDIATGFAAGGNDYIIKPVHADEVVARVSHQIERLSLSRELHALNRELEDRVRARTAELTVMNKQLREEINERRYIQDRLRYLAEHDFVSRTYNRNALESHVADIISKHLLDQTRATYLQIDLDRFRLVNESCGCIAGDELLSEVAELISSCLNRDDFLARIGGDRFGIVCQHTSNLTGQSLAQLITDTFSHYTFRWDEREFHITLSIALIPFASQILSFDQLLMIADEMTFLAKRQGGNRIVPYNPQQHDDSASRSNGNWALRLVDAFKHDHFRIFVQKICPLAQPNKTLRLEALVRLYDEDKQAILTPDKFLHAAERFQILPDLDRWMIQHVCQFIAAHPTFHEKLDSISVNLSALTLRDDSLPGFIANQLKTHAIAAHKLTFELTETEQVFHVQSSSQILQAISDLGCKIAIDDFGSGFASFSYLREFPFDSIKIDGVFVRDMDQSAASLSMVQSIIDLAKKLDKPVTAEFVERASLAEQLRELGVESGQGYYFHKPELLTSTSAQRLINELD